MKTLAPEIRRQLERAVAGAREVAETGARAALEALAVSHPGAFEHMGVEQRSLRRRLRAHGRQLGDRRDPRSGGQGIGRLVHECAYEHWHGMLFARFLAENCLLIEPETGVAVTLEDCEEFGKEAGVDKWAMAADFAHEMLPQVFRPAHPVFEVRLAREHRLKLEGLVESLPAAAFLAGDSLGWVYQFWQSRRKDEVNRSGSKIGADELPAVTQLFTEPYMVSFLLDNSLGAWWSARCLSESELSDASSEVDLRRKAAIPGVPLEYLRFVRIPCPSPEAVDDPRSMIGQNADMPPTLPGLTPPNPSARILPTPSSRSAPSPFSQDLPSPPGRGAGGEGNKLPLPADILDYARHLRINQTDAEQLLWALLRSRRFAGKKFRRQHPIGRYILDFYCHECKLAVELDGGQHNDAETKLRDDRRSGFLDEQGIRVVRFWNHDVLQQTESVLELLWHEVHADSSSSSPSLQTPLPGGEGLTSAAPPAGAGLISSDSSEGAGIPVVEGFRWAPAAGPFDGWPEQLGELRVIDPCCGSGHFLAAAFSMLVPMRMEREGLSAREAVDAVLRENLYGLELDPRCVELAAFALALAAWTYPDAGRYRPLPALNLACSGLSIGTTKDRWTELAAGRRNLRIALDWLHDEFRDAPILGSLLNPAKSKAARLMDFPILATALGEALADDESDERHEAAVAAQGLAKAAELLVGRYHLVATNVPYLARGKQGEKLRGFCEHRYPVGKHDLATVFLERCLELCAEGGTASVVLPQNWLFLARYKKLRERLLKTETWRLLARLGPGAFETISGEVVKATLLTLSRGTPNSRPGALFASAPPVNTMNGLDVSEFRAASEKAAQLLKIEIKGAEQAKQLRNADARVSLQTLENTERLTKFANSFLGLGTGDFDRFGRRTWEFPRRLENWSFLQSSAQTTRIFDGLSLVVAWDPAANRVHGMDEGQRRRIHNQDQSGQQAWNRLGVSVALMRGLRTSIYLGGQYDKSMAVLVPKDPRLISAIFSFCDSPDFHDRVREIDQNIIVANGTLTKVPFDLERWTNVAEQRYPNGLPRPYSDDPTQWIFHGHPCGSVVWDETETRTVHGPLRTDPNVLHVAVARLLRYRWPAEQDAEMDLADEQRAWVRRSEELCGLADEDGIVCIPSVRGEPPAGERLLELLAAAYGDSWNEGVLARLLAEAGGKSLDDWLRNQFFEQHCKRFHHRPFVWHIWDGRKRDGFHALVSYHKLAEGNGRGRRILESLTYSYLGDWIARQQDGVRRDEVGAADRLAAAEALQERLVAIIEGEPPFDIFVRWKPVHEQPIGWEPDINDGVRLNIRPFMTEDIPGGKKGAGILRAKPNVHWRKDRGKEPLTRGRRSKPPWLADEDWDPDDEEELRPQQDYPWFWPDDEFTGERRNDIHLSIAFKSAHRSMAGQDDP
ncbi:MAG: DUF559 domain-containing protein [Immundisolibacterales bacterium]|nr:DUF559 domain-containing protein [Immundisolibacterales bacterium]